MAQESQKYPKNEIIITVDGPSGVGKDDTLELLCAHLKFINLETGSLYRAIALYVILQFGDQATTDQITKAAQEMADSGDLFVYAKDPRTRDDNLEQFVATVSSVPDVRKIVMKYQHDFAAYPPNLPDGSRPRGVFISGRNVGVGVFPAAKLKFYLNATLYVKAERRFKQMKEKGVDITFEQVYETMKARDEKDKNRSAEAGKMDMAEDAILIDNSYIKLGYTFDVMVQIIKERLDQNKL